MSLDLLAIISPKPGKTDRVVELLSQVSEYVKANEPGTLKYEIMRVNKDKATGKEEVVMIEKYVSFLVCWLMRLLFDLDYSWVVI